MKKVLVVGPLLSISGYGYHSRQIFDYFYNKDNVEVSCVILPWGNTSWFVNKDYENHLIGNIIEKAVDAKIIVNNEFDLGIHIQLPNEWNKFYAKINIGVSTYVETDVCSKSWIDISSKMDHVIVPSSFTKNILLNSANNKSQYEFLSNNISVIPEYYHEDFDSNKKENSVNLDKSLTNLNTNYNYLTVGHLTSAREDCDRKSLVETLRYFCHHFKDSNDVGLILKTSVGRSTTIDRERTKDIFESIISEVRGDSIYPRVYLLHGEMSPSELYTLYTHKKVKCYLSLTKGEGFGLPLLEAARCGLPIIATNWSGHLDFLEKEFLPVDYCLEKIPEEKIDNSIFIENSKWAIADKDCVFKQLKSSYENYKSILEIANNLKHKIKVNFKKEEINKKYNELFKEYL
jgi:glycosyltransferase involved in cell wall biosynthesis